MERKIARVFPRRTSMSPTDEHAHFDGPPLWAEYDEVHISVAWTWDLPRAEWLARQWSPVAPVRIGGPALNEPGGAFMPGQYVRQGCTITSRGCPNHCWFCSVPRRERHGLVELPIQPGNNILDDNILATSRPHFERVCEMLRSQRDVQFTGGLEAARLTDWHVDQLVGLRLNQLFFAYDTPEDLEPLREASKRLLRAGLTRHKLRCYVLVGHPRDTQESAETRLLETIGLGFFPMAMLYRDETGSVEPSWLSFQRRWARPASIYAHQRAAAPPSPLLL